MSTYEIVLDESHFTAAPALPQHKDAPTEPLTPLEQFNTDVIIQVSHHPASPLGRFVFETAKQGGDTDRIVRVFENYARLKKTHQDITAEGVFTNPQDRALFETVIAQLHDERMEKRKASRREVLKFSLGFTCGSLLGSSTNRMNLLQKQAILEQDPKTKKEEKAAVARDVKLADGIMAGSLAFGAMSVLVGKGVDKFLDDYRKFNPEKRAKLVNEFMDNMDSDLAVITDKLIERDEAYSSYAK